MARNLDNVSNDKMVAFVERFPLLDIAVVTVHPRKEGDRHSIDFSVKLSEYETANRGAMKSAARELKRLSA